jgi:polar amino acid transport system permease protein
MTFSFQYVLQILPLLLLGAEVTFEATLGGMAFALVGGLILAVARMSPSRPLSRAAVAYIEFVRSTPLLIQLFFLFYVLPAFGITMSSLLTGILGLGLHYSTYTAEVYRSGIEGVPRGQWEAAVALNLPPFQTWTRVILPQAIPPIIPVLGNYLIGMFKDTPLLATITVRELLGAALNAAGESFRYLEPISLVGAIFFVLSYPSALLIRRLEVGLAIRRR